MNKTLIASLAVLVMVISIGSHALVHSVEAKGIPKCWLNSDGTVKSQYLQVLKGTGNNAKYPIPLQKGYCKN